MSKFFIENELFRINFQDGEWVDISAEQTQADDDYIMNSMLKTDAIAGKSEAKISMTLGKLAILERRIKAWSFGVPVTSGSISNLKRKYREVVIKEIDRLNTDSASFLAI
jgi:hypothetical protein